MKPAAVLYVIVLHIISITDNVVQNNWTLGKRNDNGNWLLTGSRDQLVKVYDIRAMRELCSLKGHHKEVTSLAWHPLYESVFASGGMDGTLIYCKLHLASHKTLKYMLLRFCCGSCC